MPLVVPSGVAIRQSGVAISGSDQLQAASDFEPYGTCLFRLSLVHEIFSLREIELPSFTNSTKERQSEKVGTLKEAKNVSAPKVTYLWG